MRFALAKGLELCGFSLVTLALLAGIVDKSMSEEMTLLAAGGMVFLVGWLLERRR